MELKQRIDAFVQLGSWLTDFLKFENLYQIENDYFSELSFAVETAKHKNGWFTQAEVRRSLEGIILMLQNKALQEWISTYKFKERKLCIAVIMAGNIPAVGFHDFLAVLISGFSFVGKTSTQDELILPMLAKKLKSIEPNFGTMIRFTKDRLEKFDAVIATGSNNSARYFERYFGKYPNIIRKNRTSVSVIDNETTDDQLTHLGKDIFEYYGLGCRNVSKIYIPEKFEIDRFFKAIYSFGYVIENNKYANNYLYNQTVYLMNSQKLLDNNFVILKEDKNLHSPIGVIFYERYKNKADVMGYLSDNKEHIQIVVSSDKIDFGKGQSPTLTDYADNINTLNFLANLARQQGNSN
tara:strand:- start:14933 stop:15988 length:1056 start_codon:yes stop_codon:yes gene_type:complete